MNQQISSQCCENIIPGQSCNQSQISQTEHFLQKYEDTFIADSKYSLHKSIHKILFDDIYDYELHSKTKNELYQSIQQHYDQQYKSKNDIFLLIGHAGLGKNTIIKQIAEAQNYHICRVSYSMNSTIKRIVKVLYKQVEQQCPGNLNIQKLRKALKAKLRQKVILIIDKIDSIITCSKIPKQFYEIVSLIVNLHKNILLLGVASKQNCYQMYHKSCFKKSVSHKIFMLQKLQTQAIQNFIQCKLVKISEENKIRFQYNQPLLKVLSKKIAEKSKGNIKMLLLELFKLLTSFLVPEKTSYSLTFQHIQSIQAKKFDLNRLENQKQLAIIAIYAYLKTTQSITFTLTDLLKSLAWVKESLKLPHEASSIYAKSLLKDLLQYNYIKQKSNKQQYLLLLKLSQIQYYYSQHCLYKRFFLTKK